MTRILAVAAGLAAAFTVALVLASVGSLIAAVVAGTAVLAGGLLLARPRVPGPTDEGRRRFLLILGLAGIGAVVGGSGVGRAILRWSRPDPGPLLNMMAGAVGSDALRRLQRGYHPERSGDLQLVLTPFNTANYPHESKSLKPRDPRSSHALLWGYTDRVPILVHAPGIVEGARDRTEAVTLADLAPTTAHLLGSDFPAPDGEPLPGVPRPSRAPRVIVTFVIDGGGWNVLAAWPDAWPNLRRMMGRGIVFRNGFMGSFPNVTASAHATIGTGAFPRAHGISGHHIHHRGEVRKAYGAPGEADPSLVEVPTVAEAWSEETGGRAWVGELGFQVWHLGMIGTGGRPRGDRPVAAYWDEEGDRWAPQNPELYRLPRGAPPPERLSEHLRAYFGETRGTEIQAQGGRALCCHPPIARYQGDLIEAAFEAEPIGEGEATDLLYINYKIPDYAGHVYNMLSVHERLALEAVDRELGRLERLLNRRFGSGGYVLMVTADHGQCPPVEEAGGVRLDPIQLTRDIDEHFGTTRRSLAQSVRPSELFLDHTVLREAGVTPDDVAAFLSQYRYGENIGPYVPAGAVSEQGLGRREFAGVFPGTFIRGLSEASVRRAGPGRYSRADPRMPQKLW